MIRFGLASEDELDVAGYSQIWKAVSSVVPNDATVMVISKGDDALLKLAHGRAWHFPQTTDGIYAGYHPADSAAAIAQLEQLRSQGGQFLLIPSGSFWWLEYYTGFRDHLEADYRRIWRDPYCIIYQLA
jgi:hypothetical protein